jgi:hypothetical protein
MSIVFDALPLVTPKSDAVNVTDPENNSHKNCAIEAVRYANVRTPKDVSATHKALGAAAVPVTCTPTRPVTKYRRDATAVKVLDKTVRLVEALNDVDAYEACRSMMPHGKFQFAYHAVPFHTSTLSVSVS